jgi:hypothetical protein
MDSIKAIDRKIRDLDTLKSQGLISFHEWKSARNHLTEERRKMPKNDIPEFEYELIKNILNDVLRNSLKAQLLDTEDAYRVTLGFKVPRSLTHQGSINPLIDHLRKMQAKIVLAIDNAVDTINSKNGKGYYGGSRFEELPRKEEDEEFPF